MCRQGAGTMGTVGAAAVLPTCEVDAVESAARYETATNAAMGLDNIPANYPCCSAGRTARYDAKGNIDCVATQAAGACPWQERFSVDRPGSPAYGIFGADCWWRGKVSTWHLDVLAAAGHRLPDDLASGFFGDNDGRLSPDYCRTLAAWLADHAEAFAAAAQRELGADNTSAQPVIDTIEAYRYSIWWLRFAADLADGAIAWW